MDKNFITIEDLDTIDILEDDHKLIIGNTVLGDTMSTTVKDLKTYIGQGNTSTYNLAKLVDKELPTMMIIGDMSGMSKNVSKEFDMYFITEESILKRQANIKWQGTSSIAYSKKNFTIKLHDIDNNPDPIEVDSKWGSQSVYNLKANYIDTSQLRNVVSAKIWSQIVSTRESYSDLNKSPNNGAIDGFPIKLYVNNRYVGLYDFNIPKSGWMFGMDENNTDHAFLMAETHDGSCAFKEPALIDGSDWSLEFPKTLNNKILTNFNSLIDFVINSSDIEFKNSLHEYMDVNATIDYFIYSYIMAHVDGLGKNLGIVTYDGKVFIPTMYDMDSTWGLHFAGIDFYSYAVRMPEQYNASQSLLWKRVKSLFYNEIFERYKNLRGHILSYPNIFNMFNMYNNMISTELREIEKELHPERPNFENNTLNQIVDYAWYRIKYTDNIIRILNNKINIFDKVGIEVGVFYRGNNGGERVVDSNYSTTDYITIDEWNHYHFIGNTTYGHINFYDKNKNHLLGRESSWHFSLQAPDNTCFVRVSWHINNDINTLMLLKMEQPLDENNITPFEPVYIF